MIKINKILELLPHRYPFLLVDRILELKLGEYVKAIKNVTFNEPFFTGHFPGIPVMPGVLIVEAMAQTAGILAIETDNISLDNKIVYFAGIDKCRFRSPVIPGDTLVLEGKNVKHKGPVWKVDCIASVDGKIVTEATLTATIAEAK